LEVAGVEESKVMKFNGRESNESREKVDLDHNFREEVSVFSPAARSVDGPGRSSRFRRPRSIWVRTGLRSLLELWEFRPVSGHLDRGERTPLRET
jgi:hypothetical protein